MTLDQLLAALNENPNAEIQFKLPDGSPVPAHFHVTEVGRFQKDFIDCGGTVRSSASCVLQVWVAADVDHRLNAAKLAKIIDLAAPLLKATDLPVEVEYEQRVISQYPVASVDITASGIVFHLAGKHTACLAEDRCGILAIKSGCCETTGCC